MPASHDPRVTPARPDVAAKFLEGQVEAARFVEGTPKQMSAPFAALRRRPALEAIQETQVLFGEVFNVYDEADGWAWGQAELDDYVGYVETGTLSAEVFAPTHRVGVLRSYVFSKPDLKSTPLMLLGMNARVTEIADADRFVAIARGGFMFRDHLVTLDAAAPDWVSEAERFVGAPYLWGGRDSLGVDCSGLVQTALARAAITTPRDTDMMEQSLGAEIPRDLTALKRGDLIFWPGHMGVMVDSTRMLHANSHHMATLIEP